MTPSTITRILELTYFVKLDNKTKKIIHTGDDLVKYFTIQIPSKESSTYKVYGGLLKTEKQDFSNKDFQAVLNITVYRHFLILNLGLNCFKNIRKLSTT